MNTKKCIGCEENLPESEFYLIKATGKLKVVKVGGEEVEKIIPINTIITIVDKGDLIYEFTKVD